MKYLQATFAVVMMIGVPGLAAAAGDAAAGKAKAEKCASCHGDAGVSTAAANPNLAAQKEQYLVKAMNDYKSGKRADPIHKAMIGALSDADINDIAAYYANQKCQ